MADEPSNLLERHLLLVTANLDDNLTKLDCAVLATILEHLSRQGVAWPGITRITERCQCSRSTAFVAIGKLEGFSYLRIERIRGKSNQYELGAGPNDRTSPKNRTSQESRPVRNLGLTRPKNQTGPVRNLGLNPSDSSDPNSALELGASNSSERTQAAAPLCSGYERAKALAEQEAFEKSKSDEERKKFHLRFEYQESKAKGMTNHLRTMETHFSKYLVGLIEERA